MGTMISFGLGTVHLGRPTGVWFSDGNWWYERYTPTRTVYPDGSFNERPFDALIGMSEPPPWALFEPGHEPVAPKRPWWKLW